MTAVALRPDLNLNLAGLREQMDAEQSAQRTEDISLGQIAFNLQSETPTVSLGGAEVAASEGTLNAFADFLQVPKPFLKRLGREVGKDVQETVLRSIVESMPTSAATFRFGEGGVSGIFEVGKQPLDPRRLVEVAGHVLGERGIVQRNVNTGADFSFDVHVPFESGSGVYGDGVEVEAPAALANYSWVTRQVVPETARVNDLTAAGLRFGVDLKHGLTPWVQPYAMRLACTNGMEFTDDGLRIDGRGMTIDDVLADLEVQAERAFSRVEAQVEHFYRLRETRVENPERALVRMAAERNLPQRSLRRLLDAAPTNALPDEPTMFDLTNLITTLANHSSVTNDGGRLILERAGGAIVADDAARCGHCNQKVH